MELLTPRIPESYLVLRQVGLTSYFWILHSRSSPDQSPSVGHYLMFNTICLTFGPKLWIWLPHFPTEPFHQFSFVLNMGRDKFVFYLSHNKGLTTEGVSFLPKCSTQTTVNEHLCLPSPFLKQNLEQTELLRSSVGY